jgi:23S rRNA (uridine2552-2'-O)-methyltransferase
MRRSGSSNRWLKEHFQDPYVKKAQQEGYRSRAVYKLQEVDERYHLIQPGMIVVDLGASPGGWTQYVAEKLAGKGRIFALDILPMAPLSGVECFVGDFSEDSVLQEFMKRVPEHGVDLLLSDMAPNMSGLPSVDIPRAMLLVELALDFARTTLKPGGSLFMKVFHGEGFDALVQSVRAQFESVMIRKPAASRQRSRETYLLARGYTL